MRIFTIIIFSFLFLITGCSDNIGFSKKNSSSNRGKDESPSGDNEFNGSNPSDNDSDEGGDSPPGHSRIREQRTFLEVSRPKTKVDILFVIDNSSSMGMEQTKIASRFHNFVNQIRDMDWHIAITTTDSTPLHEFENRYWSDGQLVPFSRGLYHLSSSMNIRTVRKLFSKNIQRDESGSDIERGIYTTYRTLERGAFGNTEIDQQIVQFIRFDADLAVVVVSDEDEAPIGEVDCSGGCPGSTYHKKSIPDNLIKYVNKLFGPRKVFQFHSIITHTKACFNGQGHTYGRKYKELSMKTGGVIGNVCSNDYSSILSSIGRKVLNLNKTYKLDCRPLDFDKNGIVDIGITGRNSSSTVPRYFVRGELITFDKPLEEGNYQLTYHCLK